MITVSLAASHVTHLIDRAVFSRANDGRMRTATLKFCFTLSADDANAEPPRLDIDDRRRVVIGRKASAHAVIFCKTLVVARASRGAVERREEAWS